MLVAISHYTKPLAEVDAHRTQHIEYMKTTLMKTNKMLFAGRQNPSNGAVIVANHITRDDFEKILKMDPYCIAEVAEYKIYEFNPTLVHESLQEILRN